MTPKQRAFVRAYVRSGVAYNAALEAGYCEKYAKGMSHKLLHKPDIIAEVKRMRDRLNESADKSATDVVNEYSKIAFTDRTSFLKPDDFFPNCYIYKSPEELSDDQRAVVEKVNTSWRKCERVIDGEKLCIDREEYSYVLSDKANALQQMGRHFGIFDDKLKLTGSQQNPFKNATPAQLERLKESWVQTMTDPKLLEGEYEVVNNDKG